MWEQERFLENEAQKLGFTLTKEMQRQFSDYAEFLVAYNQNVNLTAIVEPKEIAVKHFLDSLLLLLAINPTTGAALIDVGSGAGFPGVPIKIVRPDISLTLLDGLKKRVTFLELLSKKLALPYGAVHIRAEEAGRDEAFRGRFALATARAVAPLSVLCEYCLPLLALGGSFAALKAKGASEEIEAAQGALNELGAEIEAVRKYTLPDESERAIILVRKISQTPTEYPRPAAKMAKKPL